MRGSHGQEQLTGLLKDPCSPAACLTSVNLRPSSVKWGNTHIDSRGLLKTERDKARVWPTVLDKRSVFSLGARSLFLHEDAMAGGEMSKDTQVFLPPGSSFGVWSHSSSPILCLARRLPVVLGTGHHVVQLSGYNYLFILPVWNTVVSLLDCLSQ